MNYTSTLDKVLDSKVMKIAVFYHRAPEEGLSNEYYLDPVTGEPKGIVIEYMNLLCADMGVTPEYIHMPWGKQVDALKSGEVDILPKHSNTPLRAADVDFALRTINFDVVGVVHKDRPQTMEGLNQDGVKIATTRGSSNEEVIKKHFPKATLVSIDEYMQGTELLRKGEVAAWVESPVAKTLLEVCPDLDVLRDQDGVLIRLNVEFAHPGVKQGDTRFVNFIINWQQYRDATGDLPEMWDRWKTCLID